MIETLTLPSHVSPALVRDIDIYNLEGGETDAVAAWGKVQQESPDIFYAPAYGGYWVATRKALFDIALSDPVVFSSRCGPNIPPLPPEVPPFGPLMSDPPEHRFFRMPLNVALSPPRVRDLAVRAREVVIERLDSFYEKGECEFMHDMAMHVPVAIVMQIFDLPFSDRTRLIPLVDIITHSEDLAKRAEAIEGVMIYADEWVTRREQQPGNDAISALIANRIDDRPATHQEVVATLTVLLLGGLDSVSHTMGVIMRFLAENPGHQRQLAENPDLIPEALDELLRRHAISMTVRQLTQDYELGGVQMKAGDRILLPLPVTSLDDRVWDNPLEVDFARRPKDIMNFGKGIHKCVGLNLARAELTALLQEWFKRIPSFSIKPGDRPATTTGQILGVVHLPLSWPVR